MPVKRVNTRVLVEAGVMIALASVLSMIKVYHAPQGGSVTAGSMVPVLVLALRWGPRAGILTGIAYGFVQQLIEPFVVHPVQAILDYPVAFGVLGLTGFFRQSPALGCLVGILGRFVAHVVSGLVFFASYTPAGSIPLVYSLVYNGSYLVPEVLISAVVIYFLSTSRVLQWGNAGEPHPG
ncbi:MAG: energy-coupled thiamine transporter ThiT [Firmicutes bacterium]|nr:energy-coupled thiamine transporter ThiT [Bacillota bacterium]